jgi:hypothetical protein
MTPLLEFLVNERLATLRREAERERLVRAAWKDSRRGRRGPLGWLLTRRPRLVTHGTRRARIRLGRGQA